MRRLIACLGLTLLLTGPVRAGELDDDFGPKTAPAAVKAPADSAAVSVASTTELDAESAAQACFFRGGWGRGYGYGLGGYGLGYGWGRGYGYGLGGYGLGYGWGGYGLGYGYSPVLAYSTAYYGSGIGFGWGGYGGWGYGGYGCW